MIDIYVLSTSARTESAARQNASVHCYVKNMRLESEKEKGLSRIIIKIPKRGGQGMKNWWLNANIEILKRSIFLLEQ